MSYSLLLDAEKAYHEFMSEFQKGIYVDSENLTMKDITEQWLEAKQSQLRPSTHRHRYSSCQKWIIPFLGNIKIHQLKVSYGQAFMPHLLKHLSPSTAINVFSLAVSILSRAVQYEYIYKNPFTYLERARRKKKEVMTWSFENLQTFLDFVKKRNSFYYGIFATAALTGIRKGEVLGLREKDIDYQHKKISVIKNVANIKGQVYLSDVKTHSSRRRISIDDQLLSILSKQMKCNKKMDCNIGPLIKMRKVLSSHTPTVLYILHQV